MSATSTNAPLSSEHGAIDSNVRLPAAKIEAAARLFERDPYRELNAIIWTVACARLIVFFARRQPTAAEVAFVANRVARASAPRHIALHLFDDWPDSLPRVSRTDIQNVAAAIFDTDRWRSYLLKPFLCRARAADVVTVAARVWPLPAGPTDDRS